MNCCEWKGVGCNSTTWYVVKLDLRILSYTPSFTVSYKDIVEWEGEMPFELEASKLDSSLLQLKYLNYLDLSGNNFNGSELPQFLGEMNAIEYLNLSKANFKRDLFPPQLGNLTNLQVLDVSYIHRNEGSVFSVGQTFEWLSTLSSLKSLYMGGTNLKRVHNLLPMLNKLPFLSVLSLSNCRLDDAQFSPTYSNLTLLSSVQELYISGNIFVGPPVLLKNMSSLIVLDLSYNSYVNWSSILIWLTDLKDLEFLDISRNSGLTKMEGGLWRFLSGLCHLKTFDISSNKFHQESLEWNKNISRGCIKYDLEELYARSSKLTGVLPDELRQFKKLKYIDLSNNRLHGSIPVSIGSLTALLELNLQKNQFNGSLPASLGNLLSLRKLNLQNNQFYGAIPTSIGNLLDLKSLNLSNNKLSSVVPYSIGQLVNLEVIDLSSNNLTGNISETHFLNVTKLKDLRFNSNQLTIAISPDWIPPFGVRFIDMSSCKIGTISPRWLGTQKELNWLVLVDANITGPWPKWLPSSLGALDLSHNKISGNIPHNIADLLPGLLHFILFNNLLNGTIPSSFCKMQYLMTLDISRNMLSGNIPNCWEDNHIMGSETIKLSFNKLTGVIPSSIGNLSGLEWLHLDNNRLTGDIPSSLRNCKQLVVFNLGDNGFSGNIPSWMGIQMNLMQALVLRNNGFDGYIPRELCQMESLRILDLAHNNFTGNIPRCLGSLTAMTMKHSLDMNNISGVGVWYPEWADEYLALTIKRLKLEYTSSSLPIIVLMDLSSNHLIGKIPQELTLLSQLLSLNLSQNHLTGTIPESIGNLMALQSLDLANNQLSGNIPISMSLLQSLSSLNLSHNNFSGRIPTGNQLQALPDPSIYDGNPNLCGFPLTKSCAGDEPPHVSISNKEENDEEDKSYKIWLYLAITIGYGVGLWAFFGILMFRKKWRYAYFRYVDYAMDWIYVFIAVNARRLKRKMVGVQE